MGADDQTDDGAEVFEHVPWSQLVVEPPRSRSWIAYLAAGAIALAAVGAMVARSWRPTVNEITTVPTVTTVLPMDSHPPPDTLPAPEEDPFTEADLMAAGVDERAVAVRAEWFVTDYFSSGGDPAGSGAVLDALPRGAVAEGAASDDSSFVEWASTVSVDMVGSDRYRARVLFRMLGGRTADGFVRLPVRAVDVLVAVDSRGALQVMDLPAPAGFPESAEVEMSARTAAEPPAAVRAAALEIGGAWGSDPRISEVLAESDLFRVVLAVGDEAGISWPLVVWLTGDGLPAWP